MVYLSNDGRVRRPVPPLEIGDRVQLFWPGVRTARVIGFQGRLAHIRFTKARHNGDLACTYEVVKKASLLYHPSRRDILRRAEEVMETWSEEERDIRRGIVEQEKYTIPETDIDRSGMVVRKTHCH